ncbi:hypothetical protein PEDI_14830 [Persicobacter diffluens]|uniref:Uncharacterized protein n=1 Tax=Persicobacter diffluens TaxID=981 RepID=A0AAN4VXM7_9BACT|nr:hypothetical protein PEDI_14830 [Persicobacter diffluens]
MWVFIDWLCLVLFFFEYFWEIKFYTKLPLNTAVRIIKIWADIYLCNPLMDLQGISNEFT